MNYLCLVIPHVVSTCTWWLLDAQSESDRVVRAVLCWISGRQRMVIQCEHHQGGGAQLLAINCEHHLLPPAPGAAWLSQRQGDSGWSQQTCPAAKFLSLWNVEYLDLILTYIKLEYFVPSTTKLVCMTWMNAMRFAVWGALSDRIVKLISLMVSNIWVPSDSWL